MESSEQQIPAAEMEGMMKAQELILKAATEKLNWWEAAEIMRVTDRTMRRITSVSLYVAGLARRDIWLGGDGLLSGQAVAHAEILTTVLKHIDVRVPPITFQRQGNYWDSWLKAKALACAAMGVFRLVIP